MNCVLSVVSSQVVFGHGVCHRNRKESTETLIKKTNKKNADDKHIKHIQYDWLCGSAVTISYYTDRLWVQPPESLGHLRIENEVCTSYLSLWQNI